MKLYQPYLERLRDVLNLGILGEVKNYPHIGDLHERDMIRSINESLVQLDLQKTPLQSIADLFGIRSYRGPVLAPHPDFAYLKQSETSTEEHYIVSVFVDVKGSTGMFKRLTKEQVHGIVNIVVRAATHTFTLFGGFTQRIMFDGIFFYFGGKSMSQKQAVMDAVHGATMFCHFMQNELPVLFSEYELEKVYARVGIDFGDAEDVLWGLHGTVDCGELSTTSLHTSLAAKMQKEADSNGIVLGQYMRDRMDDKTLPFCKVGDPKYIFQSKDFNYAQYHFIWAAYLKEVLKNNVRIQSDGTLLIDPTTAGWGIAVAPNERLQILGERIRLMEAGNSKAFINSSGHITSEPTHIPVPKNSFYSDGK